MKFVVGLFALPPDKLDGLRQAAIDERMGLEPHPCMVGAS